MKSVIKIVVLISLFTGCKQKAAYSLFVKNKQGQSELIADFYQKLEGKEDCENLRKAWPSHESWCAVNE